jgi:hypothetical protein
MLTAMARRQTLVSRCHESRFRAATWRVLSIVAVLGCGCTTASESRWSELSTGGTASGGEGDGTVAMGGAAPVNGRFELNARIRRLTRLEFQNTLSDLWGEQTGALAGFLEQDATSTKYATGADRGVSSNYVSDLNRIAELASAELDQASEMLAISKECSLDAASASACATTFIRTFGARAWRRPLTDAEVEELLSVYQAGRRLPTTASPLPG